MRKILILSILCYFALPVFAERTVITQNPVPSYQYPYQTNFREFPINSWQTPYSSDMNALEKYIFNRNYRRENDLMRLQRLELQAFGAVQQGDFNSRYENVRSAILSRPKQSYRTSVLNNIGNYFTGQMTGFSPSVNQYGQPYNYNNPVFEVSPNFGRTYNSGYFSPWGNRYTTRNYGTGATGSIRILD